MEEGKTRGQLFDEWPEKYDFWFTTPIGSLIRRVESDLILDLLEPAPGEKVLDAGCGTGVFTLDIVSRGAKVTGVDLSLPMLRRAREKAAGFPFQPSSADILCLPFPDDSFEKTVSVTALEFISDAEKAVSELFRVTRRGGTIIVATLNRLSPWAERRRKKAKEGHSLFQRVIFRSPEEFAFLAPVKGEVRTAIHFLKEDDPDLAWKKEEEGRNLETGAFLVIRWVKP